ncbi:MAG TPA: RCC1 repeat-containing protein [Archangium sp.]|nr:RCC1 repeat-containing protein [Archangium sp.]
MRNRWMALLGAVLLSSDGGAWASQDQTKAHRSLRGVLSTAGGYSVALDADGTVWAWGGNGYGQLGDGTKWPRDLPASLETIDHVKFIDAGASHTVALREDGTVWSWGNNANGQLGRPTSTRFDPLPAQVPGLTGVVALSAGAGHVLALREDGTVWAWGINQFLQLGFPHATSAHPTPRQVPALTDVVEVAAGSNFSLARRADGSVWIWGLDPTLPTPWAGEGLSPQRVDVPKQVIALAAGGLPLVMTRDGTLWGWGRNMYGSLGTGTNSRSTPVQVGDLSKIVTLSAGGFGALALREDGTVWGWGDNRFAQLSPWLPELQATPSQVMDLPKVVALATGVVHVLAVAEDGTVWGWGDNNDGQYGPMLPTASPVQVEGLSGMVAVTTGNSFSLALREDGTVWGLGRNSSGQLGWPPDFGIHTTPRQVPDLAGVRALAAGAAHTLALREDGSVWAWGDNWNGQLGVETSVQARHTPAPVPGLTDVVAISAGQDFSLALRGDGTLWSWGDNSRAQLGDGTLVSRYTPAPVPGLTDVVRLMTTTYGPSLVVRRDGTVWGFGHNAMGVLAHTHQQFYTTPVQLPALAGVKGLSAGYEAGYALLEDGTVRAWGSNAYDQIGDGVSSIHLTPAQVRLPCRFTAMTSRDHRASEVKHCPAMP